ncbi:hypothetical protein BV25DRAFT_711262 [Artomyces pyxidatus]|uniref:Uncharacterized protein n=1 Tax=Artomyces pyxidatus TaxID=48021 RepID=A0ACB8SZB9_9AGAM|nr:hypothetical protein BV25DRAFT_711262 [Artomyces pyxidatus]
MSDSSREVYILAYNAGAGFAMHWALFIPHLSGSRPGGKLIEANGNPFAGFELGIDRHYDPAEERRSHARFLLARVQGHTVADADESAPTSVPVDEFERIALATPAPSRSLRSAGQGAAKPTRITVENCQSWLFRYVQALVDTKVMGQDALERLAAVPK